MQLLQKIPPFFYNKYFLTIVGFMVWLTFFDRNNLINRYKLNQELRRINYEKDFYESETKKDKKTTEELSKNIDYAEKYGREVYMMKKPNEDIFLIVKEEETQEE